MKRLLLAALLIAAASLLTGCPPQKPPDICPGFAHCAVLAWSGQASTVLRGPTCSSLQPIAIPTSNPYTDVTVVPGQSYCYAVGNMRGISNLVTTKIPPSAKSNKSLVMTSAQNWQIVSTPTSAAHLNNFAVDGSNNWYLADRVTGLWKSINQGASWTQVNYGLANTDGWSIQYGPTGDMIASIYNPNYPSAGPVHFYLSTNGGGSWTQIAEPSGYTNSVAPARACIISAGPGAVTDCGGLFGPAGMTAMYSTGSNFNSTALISQGANSSIYDFFYNAFTGKYLMGTETQGLWQSSDGITFAAISPGSTTGIRVGNIKGITYATDGTPLFTAQGGVWKCNQTTNCASPTNVLGNTNTSAGNALYRDSVGSIYEGHNHDTANPITIYRSLDQGTSWQEWDTGIPAGLDAVQFLENRNDGMLYAVMADDATNAGWLYRTPIVTVALPQAPTLNVVAN